MKGAGQHWVGVFFLISIAQSTNESAVNQNGLGKNILSVFPFIYLTTRE